MKTDYSIFSDECRATLEESDGWVRQWSFTEIVKQHNLENNSERVVSYCRQ